MTPFSFDLKATDGQARAGVFHTPHGVVETPVFMPVGTQGTVKMLTWDQVAALGAQMVLGNAYHLYLRPGHRTIERFGGLHTWCNWQGPMLTDSGGFQVFSLAGIRKIGDDGVTFKDPVDGTTHFIGPKESMAIQNALGADVIMAFDECPPYPVEKAYAEQSLEKTHRWLETCFKHHARPNDQALFPIVQGSVFEDLRARSAEFVQQFPAHGFAIGGVSVGESKEWVRKVVTFTAPLMPANKPRYLMGVGTPEDLLNSIQDGIDMFDCVMPSRIGRHGSFFSSQGHRIIRNAEFAEDLGPLDEGCDCLACTRHSRAYIRHLYRQQEPSASVLLTLHNIRFLIRLVEDARRAILAGHFADFYTQKMHELTAKKT